MENPYLDYFTELTAGKSDYDFDVVRARYSACQRWAFAIPSAVAIRALVSHGPIVEIGAGTGYWGWLIEQAGGDIVMYDTAPPATYKNRYRFEHTYARVRRGGPYHLKWHKNRTLFLCWPPYQSSMATDALDNYLGTKIVYIGEHYGGCTADDAFHDRLEAEWVLLDEIEIPRWHGVYDSMWIYEHK